MGRKVRNIIFKSLMLLSFGGFFALTIMSFKQGQTRIDVKNTVIDIDYNQGHAFVSKQIVADSIYKFFSENHDADSKSLTKLEIFLKSYPYIQRANAFIDAQSVLHVSIEQIMPIARVVTNTGKGYYVDIHGKKKPLSDIYTAKVPVLTGDISEKLVTNEKVQSAELKSLMKVILETKEDKYWSAQIAQLNISGNGHIQLIPRIGGHIVELGDSTGIADKLDRLDLFYDKVLKKAGWDKYKIIDVKYKNQIVCK